MRPPVLILCAIALTGCGATAISTTTPTKHDDHALAALAARSRPIGVSARFRPALRDRPVAACRATLGPRDGVHVELFAANRVVLVPAGIGTRPPRRTDGGRVTTARCYGALVTLDPTGVVLVRRGEPATLGALFDSWGQTLSRRRLLSFGGRVVVFVNGHRLRGDPRTTRLRRHDEVVVEVGPLVAPHRDYAFAPGA